MKNLSDERNSWNKFWSKRGYTSALKIRRHVSLSARTKKIENRVEKIFGSLKGLEIIELGSGMGTQSLSMALKGANITLVDFNDVALKKAKQLFNEFGLNPTLCKSDIFNLDQDFVGKFHISMSFGTVEHFFSELKRSKAIGIHHKVIKEGGVSFISVPNKMCPHYRVFLLLLRMIGRKISEKPFDSRELIRYAKQATYKHCETFGSSFFEFDFLMPYFYAPVQAQITTPFDNYCAHLLTLFGVK